MDPLDAVRDRVVRGGAADPAGCGALLGGAHVHDRARRAAADRRHALLDRRRAALRGGRGGCEHERALPPAGHAQREHAGGDRARHPGQGLQWRQSGSDRDRCRPRRGARVRTRRHLFLHVLSDELRRRAPGGRRRRREQDESVGARVGLGLDVCAGTHGFRHGLRLSAREHRRQQQRLRGAAGRQRDHRSVGAESVGGHPAVCARLPHGPAERRRRRRDGNPVRARRNVRRRPTLCELLPAPDLVGPHRRHDRAPNRRQHDAGRGPLRDRVRRGAADRARVRSASTERALRVDVGRRHGCEQQDLSDRRLREHGADDHVAAAPHDDVDVQLDVDVTQHVNVDEHLDEPADDDVHVVVVEQ